MFRVVEKLFILRQEARLEELERSFAFLTLIHTSEQPVKLLAQFPR